MTELQTLTTARLTSNGQLNLPKALCQSLSLRKGTLLRCLATKTHLVLTPVRHLSPGERKEVAAILKTRRKRK